MPELDFEEDVKPMDGFDVLESWMIIVQMISEQRFYRAHSDLMKFIERFPEHAEHPNVVRARKLLDDFIESEKHKDVPIQPIEE